MLRNIDYSLFIPAAVINNRSSKATTPSAATLATQMIISQPMRRHQLGFVISSLIKLALFLMIAFACFDFTSEDVIRPESVNENDRDNKQRAD